MSDDEKKTEQPGKVLLLALHMTNEGPSVDMKGDPRFVLRLLGNVMEDLREQCAVEAVNRMIVKAAASQRIQPVGNGVIGLNGKPLV